MNRDQVQREWEGSRQQADAIRKAIIASAIKHGAALDADGHTIGAADCTYLSFDVSPARVSGWFDPPSGKFSVRIGRRGETGSYCGTSRNHDVEKLGALVAEHLTAKIQIAERQEKDRRTKEQRESIERKAVEDAAAKWDGVSNARNGCVSCRLGKVEITHKLSPAKLTQLIQAALTILHEQEPTP